MLKVTVIKRRVTPDVPVEHYEIRIWHTATGIGFKLMLNSDLSLQGAITSIHNQVESYIGD